MLLLGGQKQGGKRFILSGCTYFLSKAADVKWHHECSLHRPCVLCRELSYILFQTHIDNLGSAEVHSVEDPDYNSNLTAMKIVWVACDANSNAKRHLADTLLYSSQHVERETDISYQGRGTTCR